MKPFRAPGNYKRRALRRAGYYSEPMKALRAFNRISAKHFDFVVCALDTLAPLAAIELNDASHQRPDRQKRDELLRGICRDIGLPLIELAPRRAYKLDSLRQQVFSPDCFTELGIELKRKRLVVVKSTQHFRAGFDPLVVEVVYADTPGSLRVDLGQLPFRHLRRPLWPLDRG